MSKRQDHTKPATGSRPSATPLPSQPRTDHTTRTATRSLFAWVLLPCLLLIGAMAAPFFWGHYYIFDDLAAFHLPMRAFYADCLAEGEPFDWDPRLFAGFYFTGEGQAGPYHPLHLLLYRALPLRGAFCLEVLSSYPLLLAGMYCFLKRRLGRPDAALFGGLVFAFSGFSLLHFMHTNAIAVLAHIPWLLWAIDVLFTSERRQRRSLAALAIALLTASELLLGYPQMVWFSLVTEGAFLLFLWRAGELSWRGFVWFVEAQLLGLLIGAVQWVPTLDAMRHSTRQTAGPDFFFVGSLHPLNVVQLLGPYLFAHRVLVGNTHELGLYVGAVPLMLVVWLIAHAREVGPTKRLALAALGFGGLMLVLSFGRAGLLYHVQVWLPIVQRFRFPSRYIALFSLAVAVAAAVAFGELARRAASPHQPAARVSRAPFVVVLISISLALAAPFVLGDQLLGDYAHRAAGPLLLLCAAILLAAAERGQRWAVVALACFATLDLGIYGLSYAVYPRTATFKDLARVSFPSIEPGEGRVVIAPPGDTELRLRVGNQCLLSGWQRLDGYAGLEPAKQLDYRHEPALRVASVQWVPAVRANTSEQQPAGPRAQWIEVAALPRVRLVTRAISSRNPRADLEKIPIESTALVERPITLSGRAPGTLHVLAQRPGRFDIATVCRDRQLLVVAESYHPGWRATIDGQAAELLRVNGDFFGTVVEAGEHVVRFTFQPQSLRLGKWLSAAGLLTATCLALVRLRR